MQDAIARARYLALETYRRDGSAVRTPVWCVAHEGAIAVWTDGASHKARRLRREPRARVAPCNATGARLLGPWTRCAVQVDDDPAVVRAVHAAIGRKYGIQRALIELTFRFRGIRADGFVALLLQPGLEPG